jgi:hypothetical protein
MVKKTDMLRIGKNTHKLLKMLKAETDAKSMDEVLIKLVPDNIKKRRGFRDDDFV